MAFDRLTLVEQNKLLALGVLNFCESIRKRLGQTNIRRKQTTDPQLSTIYLLQNLRSTRTTPRPAESF